MIIQQHIQEMQEVAQGGFSKKFNCWGATQYALGHRRKYGWVGESVMHRWIQEKTIIVNDDNLLVGDILVISNDKYCHLIHTAVYMGDGVWFHKEGKFEASFDSKEMVLMKYTDDGYFWGGGNPKIEIRRVKKKKELPLKKRSSHHYKFKYNLDHLDY